MARIYVVEDDASIREIEVIALKNSNYEVEAFERASDMYLRMGKMLPDLLLLDIMLPDEDGLRIVRRLREDPRTKRLPVILVTAKTAEMDMVRGLDNGADDYIRKPFSILELLSRVKALLRRTQKEEETAQKEFFSVGEIELDHERNIVQAEGRQVELTYKEYELLRFLMINAEIVQTRESIMRYVWGTGYEGETRTVDMHVKTLRQKLGRCGRLIGTVRNVGYVIHQDNEPERGAENETDN